LPQRIGEEKAPKGLVPFGNPQAVALSLSFGGYQKASCLVKVLRRQIQRFAFCCKQAITSRTLFAALQRERREDTYTLPVLFLHFCHHERQARKQGLLLFVLHKIYTVIRRVERWLAFLLSHLAFHFRVCEFFNLQTQALKMKAFAKR
jgi:hypothetical protein